MKTPVTLLGLFFSVATVIEVCAQSKESAPVDKNFPNTLQPVNPVKYYGPRKVKKQKKTVTHDAVNEYNNRIENTWRERDKRERSFESDYMKPPYFGHKKPPKIRSIEKRKYCKICGIRH